MRSSFTFFHVKTAVNLLYHIHNSFLIIVEKSKIYAYWIQR